MKAAYALALVGVLALLSPAVTARQLKQDTSAITDADILNFALNLEVGKQAQIVVVTASRHLAQAFADLHRLPISLTHLAVLFCSASKPSFTPVLCMVMGCQMS